MPKESLIRPLFDGPLDIVGDVHGEIDALETLLERLDYRADGTHPEGRRLVFLGDLVDRGPDSPAVVGRVEQLVADGRAQCVLGNHDLNLLLEHRKNENRWFYGKTASLDKSDRTTPQQLADGKTRKALRRFFCSLPLGLERDDLRVVHAHWQPSMVELARQATDAVSLYEQFHAEIEQSFDARPPLDAIDRDLEQQNRNPVKMLTSGPEQRAPQPFESNGKLRYEQRVRWWQDYHEVVPCAFGHYSLADHDPGRNGRALCLDFCVGQRWRERAAPGFDGVFRYRLAALRWPQRRIVFDDGSGILATG